MRICSPACLWLAAAAQKTRDDRDLTIMIWLIILLFVAAIGVAVFFLVRSYRQRKAATAVPETPPEYDIGTLREYYDLTPREGEVLACMLAGDDDMSIAGKLSITLTTVQGHIRRIYEKTNARSFRELIGACRMCEKPGTPPV